MSNPPQSVIESTVGPLFLGFAAQQLFLGIIFIQASRYFTRFRYQDSKFYVSPMATCRRYLVGVLLVLNILEGAMDIHVLYRTMVLHYGDYQYFDLQTWTMWSEPGITAFVGFLAQLFFMERCVKVTKRSPYVIVSLALLLLLSLGSGVAVSVSFFNVKLFSQLAKIPIPISCWLISTAVTDLTIAGILSIALIRSSSTFVRTETVIFKLIRLSMETSFATAVTAVLNLVLYFAKMTTAYHLLPQFSICRIYTITVLVTLLERDSLRHELDGSSSYFQDYSSFRFCRPREVRTASNAVEVKMTTIIERDHTVEGSINDKPESDLEPRRSQIDTKLIWTSTV
ncbi:hypothetical protein DFH09DRAFT_1081633 [Mycena vulgaris]|nr:hypothetical protein DFH09DRAFT_1081633 [Mycena vulgaris]